MSTIHTTSSPEETEAVAEGLARSLQPGAVIALEGDLGAGKTRFVRGLVRGLAGDPRRVSSPTFVLLNVYPTQTLTVYHLDAYRITADDLDAIGFDELLEQGGVVVVEWASRVLARLPAARIDITIESTDETTRVICIQPDLKSSIL